jgi:HD-like signal output (HDOD) protein
MNDRVAQIIAQAPPLPPLPATSIRLSELLSDPSGSVGDIAQVLQYDQGATAKLLRLCNSAYLGFPEKVTSVRDAIVRLGTSMVFQLILVSSSRPMLKRKAKGYALPAGALWRQAVGTAILAQRICRLQMRSAAGAAFTAGLLLDIGKLVLCHSVGREYEKLLEAAHEGEVGFEEAERRVLGVSHSEIGAALAEQWSLPAEIVSCIRHHHDPAAAPEEHRDPVTIVHLADAIAMLMGFGLGNDGMKHPAKVDAAERLGMDQDAFDAFCAQAFMDYTHVLKLFREN